MTKICSCFHSWSRGVLDFKFGKLYEYGSSQVQRAIRTTDPRITAYVSLSRSQVGRNEELQRELTWTRGKLDRMDNALTQYYIDQEDNVFKDAMRQARSTEWQDMQVTPSDHAERFRSARIIARQDEMRAHVISVSSQQLLPGT